MARPHILEPIEHVQEFAMEWLWSVNKDRPDMGIGGLALEMKLNMTA